MSASNNSLPSPSAASVGSSFPINAIKSKAALNNMNKNMIVNYAVDLGSTLTDLRNALLHPDTGLVPMLQRQNEVLHSQLKITQQVNQSLLDHLWKVEKTAIENAQYARRETLELHGIPESFGQGHTLEKNVMGLLNDLLADGSNEGEADSVTGEGAPRLVPGAQSYAETTSKPAKLVERDFHAIHRLYKKDRVIIKFTNRKRAKEVIGKKDVLKKSAVRNKCGITNRVFLNESMCPAIKNLFYQCKKLKEASKIVHYAFSNGSLRIRVNDGDSRKYTIAHVNDITKATGLSKKEIDQIVSGEQPISDALSTASNPASEIASV